MRVGSKPKETPHTPQTLEQMHKREQEAKVLPVTYDSMLLPIPPNLWEEEPSLQPQASSQGVGGTCFSP